MKDGLHSIIDRHVPGHCEFLGIHFWNYFENLPARGCECGIGFDLRAGWQNDRGDLPQAVRQERAASSDRDVPDVYVARLRCRDGEGLPNLEASITKRHAAARASLRAQPLDEKYLVKGIRLYLQSKAIEDFFFIRTG